MSDVINICKCSSGEPVSIEFFCPGCGCNHSIYYQDTPEKFVGPRWTWNGDKVKPVIAPSLAARLDWIGENCICHSYVGTHGAQPGEIIFLPDCTHHSAGKVVPLVPWEENYDDFSDERESEIRANFSK